jgi:hypothetical protein
MAQCTTDAINSNLLLQVALQGIVPDYGISALCFGSNNFYLYQLLFKQQLN